LRRTADGRIKLQGLAAEDGGLQKHPLPGGGRGDLEQQIGGFVNCLTDEDDPRSARRGGGVESCASQATMAAIFLQIQRDRRII
jgi:hypothetical protein